MASQKTSPSQKFSQQVVQATGIVFLMGLLVLLLIFGFRVVLYILAGVLVAAFFTGIAQFIRDRTPVGRNWGLVLAVVLVLGVATGTGFLLAPSIDRQVASLKEQLPEAANKTLSQLKSSQVGGFLVARAQEVELQPKRSQVTSFFGSVFGFFSTAYIVLFLGFFFMIDPGAYRDGLVRLFPKDKRDRTKEILTVMGQTLRKWLLGKLLSMAIVGVLSGIGLTILGVPLALTLALFAALISFVPNFGPLLALLPAFLLGYTVDPLTGLYVVLLYAGIQAIESNVLTPLIQKEMISFPMAMVLIAQVVLGIFTGVLGVILAVPLVAVIMVLVKMAYIQDVLHDDDLDIAASGQED
ncbi:AI-2E family transporter [Maribacter sp. 2307ULW6-5]|uniref:AI-2E family transporter n=1 Tax=Maribacter sp. 2307ULW6-5 TaxID=3386275 RepID=UPI0039BC50CD